ncbi:MAG: PEP-CTERM sorting domain-containing protein [bacterium]
MTPNKLFLLLILMVLCGATSAVKADPLSFSNVVALQNNGGTRVDLFSNPGVTLFGPQITFLVDITGDLPPGGSSLLQITYTEAGSAPIALTFPIPAFGNIPPPYTQLFTITSPGATFAGTPATLTISIPGNGSQTYTFNVAQPVPEPASLALLGTGMLGIWSKVRRRRRSAKSQREISAPSGH